MKITKSLLGVLLVSFALAVSPAYAHCGKCGVGDDKAASAHSGAQCPMHGEKNATLLEAASALEGSNAGLSAKLKDMAAHCCGAH